MDYTLMFPSKYVKAADFKGKDVTLTIETVTISSLEGSDGTNKQKGVVSFAGTPKLWILNRTCAEACKLMWGVETNDWVGKQITLFPATIPDPFSGGMTSAIRVRGSPSLQKAASATIQRGRKTLKVSVMPTGPKKPQRKLTAEEAAEVARMPADRRDAATKIHQMEPQQEPPADMELPTLSPFGDA